MGNEMNEKELLQVAGGAGEEHQVSFDIVIPHTGGSVIVKVYFDGVHDGSKTAVVDSNLVSRYAFTFCGSGTSQIKFVLSNGKIYYYQVNFDESTVTRIS